LADVQGAKRQPTLGQLQWVRYPANPAIPTAGKNNPSSLMNE